MTRDVVLTFSSCDTYGDARRREMAMPTDRLLETVLASPAVDRLLAVNAFRSLPIRVGRKLTGWREPPFPSVPGRHALLTPFRVRRRDPVGVPGLQRAYARYDRLMAGAARRLGMDRPAVIATNPFVAAFAPLAWASRVVYFGWDDWAAWPPHERWWADYRAAYDRIRERRLPVCAVSQVLLDRLRPSGPAAVVPNGIDPVEWSDPLPPPSWFEELARPRMLYIGSLDERLDTEAISELAARYSGGTIVLLGTVLNAEALAPVLRLENVVVRAPEPRRTVVSVVANAEACIMPHQRTPLTEAMSPLKVYEYLAGGQPVVATDLPPVRDIDPRVRLVPAGQSIADAVGEALARGPASPQERSGFLHRNSWACRHQVILDMALG